MSIVDHFHAVSDRYLALSQQPFVVALFLVRPFSVYLLSLSYQVGSAAGAAVAVTMPTCYHSLPLLHHWHCVSLSDSHLVYSERPRVDPPVCYRHWHVPCSLCVSLGPQALPPPPPPLPRLRYWMSGIESSALHSPCARICDSFAYCPLLFAVLRPPLGQCSHSSLSSCCCCCCYLDG